MSAITDEPEGVVEPLKVLITLHDGMDSMDAIGPLSVFGWAQHDPQNAGKYQVFRCPDHSNTLATQGLTRCTIRRHQGIPHRLRGSAGARGHRPRCLIPRPYDLRRCHEASLRDRRPRHPRRQP